MNSELSQKIINYALDELSTRKGEGAVSICDKAGHLFAFARTTNAPLASIQICMNKAYTAVMERKPSFEVGNMLRDKSLGYDVSFYGDPRITGFGGGVPVFKNSEIIGGIGVSGLPEEEDMEVVAKILEKIKSDL